MIDKLLQFLKDKQTISDEEMHKWAKENGYDVHQVEAACYKLASIFARFWLGGKSREENITAQKVNPEELQMGIKVEYEHTPDEWVAKKIALDHLAEMDDYYTRLKKMEEGAGVEH